MLVAYIDDSGTDRKGHVATLAGFIASAEQWHEFSGKWRSVLNQHPRIEYFKMKEAHRLEDQFKEFSVPERDQRVSQLAALIGELKPHAVASVVWWEDFREFQKCFTNPVQVYLVLYQSVFWTILTTLRLRFPGEQVEIVYDEQGALGTKAASVNDWATLALSKRYRSVLAGNPVHRDSKRVLPLQAADMLAWHIRRGATAEGWTVSQMPQEFDGLQLGYRLLSKDRLARMAAHARELIERFPDIEAVYSPAELKEIRNKFLGYDPDVVA